MKRFELPNGFTFDSYLRKIVEEKFDELHKMLEAQLVKKGVIKSWK